MSKIVQRAEYKSKSALKLNLVPPSAFLHPLKLCGDKKFNEIFVNHQQLCLSKQANTPYHHHIRHCFLTIFDNYEVRKNMPPA